ncbi:MAG TPA: hypothetical protein VHE34_16820 [Puia sp.]|uniref:plasmid mobilization protein n=1 Tax=Puia sp. TaxID=2045100 RepID=UPI002CF496EE|nr:hypothetical protein [Puia sp.]HVU96896.1 hypothetical protein [Puia sp.]
MSSQSKKNTGRPTKPIKREKPMGIRLTLSERFIITQKAERAGMTLTAYLRHMAINGKVTARPGEEDRNIAKQLIKMTAEIHQLVEIADKQGMLKATLQFEGLRSRIDNLIDQFNHDK